MKIKKSRAKHQTVLILLVLLCVDGAVVASTKKRHGRNTLHHQRHHHSRSSVENSRISSNFSQVRRSRKDIEWTQKQTQVYLRNLDYVIKRLRQNPHSKERQEYDDCFFNEILLHKDRGEKVAHHECVKRLLLRN